VGSGEKNTPHTFHFLFFMSIVSLNNLIFTIRDEKVILDAELARLGVRKSEID